MELLTHSQYQSALQLGTLFTAEIIPTALKLGDQVLAENSTGEWKITSIIQNSIIVTNTKGEKRTYCCGNVVNQSSCDCYTFQWVNHENAWRPYRYFEVLPKTFTSGVSAYFQVTFMRKLRKLEFVSKSEDGTILYSSQGFNLQISMNLIDKFDDSLLPSVQVRLNVFYANTYVDSYSAENYQENESMCRFFSKKRAEITEILEKKKDAVNQQVNKLYSEL